MPKTVSLAVTPGSSAGRGARRLRVVLADDEVLLRQGLASLLTRAGFEVVAQAGTAGELLTAVRRHRPDLAVIDVRMPPHHRTEGLDAARVIRRELPHTAMLVLSAHVDLHHLRELLSGDRPVGYLLKTRVPHVEDFLHAVRRVADGEAVVDPVLIRELAGARRRDDPVSALSAREREVLVLMAEGLSNAGIARRLYLAEATVEKHVHNVLFKLELPDSGDDNRRVQAVVMYLKGRP